MVRGNRSQLEMLQQPALIRTLLTKERSNIEELAEAIRRTEPSYAIVAARGSSSNAARYFQYVFGVYNRLTCALAAPSISTVYQSPPNMKGSLTIGMSHHGQSADVTHMVEAAAQQGALTAAMTNDAHSPLATIAKHTIQLHTAAETPLPDARAAYTAQLMVTAMLSTALQGSEQRWAALRAVPSLIQATLDLNTDMAQVEALGPMKQLFVVGRGFNYATAFETAREINETSPVSALPFSWADFLQGSGAMLKPKVPVLLISPQGRVDSDLPPLLRTIEECKTKLIVISDDDALLRLADIPLRLPMMPEWLSPLCAIVAGQIYSAALAKTTEQNQINAPESAES